MRKIAVMAAIVALVGFAAQADAAGMYGGVKGGVNFANVTGDDAPDDTSMRTGFLGGLFAGKDVSDEFGFRLELLWAQKGAEADSAGATTKLKMDYVDVPLLFVYHLPAGESVRIDLFAGPSFNFNVSGKFEGADGTEVDIDNMKSFEFGAVIGAGIAKQLAGGKAFGLDARYQLGATSVFDDVTVGTTTIESDLKTTGIGVMAFFQVPLGGAAE